MADFFGLDIGSSAIKAIQVKGKKVVGMVVGVNPIGKVGGNLIPTEKQILATAIKKILAESRIKTKEVVAGVAESLVYSKIMNFPVVSSAELASAIKWQADQEVPLPPEQVELSWVILDKPKKKTGKEQMKVLVVAVPKRVSAGMVDLLETCELEPRRAENEAVALTRWLRQFSFPGTVMVVDVGANSTKMVMIREGELIEVYSSTIGGMALTRALMQEFSLGLLQAEEYKRSYGIDKNLLDGRLFRAMEPILGSLVGEIIKMTMGYKRNQLGVVDKLVIVGGGSYLKGFLGFLSEKLGIEVVMGEVFSGFKAEGGGLGAGSAFAVALGLAIEDDE